MIFTSYYAQMRNFPSNVYPVSISLGIPKWYEGAIYQKLAPTKEILSIWKANHENNESYWEKWYDEQYKQSVLSYHLQHDVVHELEKVLPDSVKNILNSSSVSIWKNPDIHIALLCYEKSEDFCHRKLVAEWFEEAGISCKELTKEDLKKMKEEIEFYAER